MTLFIPDWSNNNWSSTSMALNVCAECINNEGFAGIEHKVSEGNYYQDPYWPPVRDWCHANNVPVIGYHYVTTNDPQSQVNTYLGAGGESNVMFDFEANSGDMGNFWAVANVFNANGITVRLSYIPQWYMGQIGGSIANVPGLISSAYWSRHQPASVIYDSAGGDNAGGWAPYYGGPVPSLFQFTDLAQMAGIEADCNAFRGTVDELRALWGLAPSTGGWLMALNDAEQAELLDGVRLIRNQLLGNPDPNRPGVAPGWPQLGDKTVVDALSDVRDQLGPWPQLGKNAAGQDLTPVDALAAVKQKVVGS